MNDQKKESRVEEIRKKAQGKANAFSELFGSPIGKEVLQEIKEQFDQDVLCGETEYTTLIRAGQRDVVRWIELVIDRGKRL